MHGKRNERERIEWNRNKNRNYRIGCVLSIHKWDFAPTYSEAHKTNQRREKKSHSTLECVKSHKQNNICILWSQTNRLFADSHIFFYFCLFAQFALSALCYCVYENMKQFISRFLWSFVYCNGLIWYFYCLHSRKCILDARNTQVNWPATAGKPNRHTVNYDTNKHFYFFNYWKWEKIRFKLALTRPSILLM